MRECILLTGGAGFIGSALSRKIGDDELDIVAIDSFLEQVHPTGARPEFLHERVIVLKADIREEETWKALLAEYKPVKIVHLAAETGTAQSLTEATRHASVNVVGTARMLEALAQTGTRPERIVLASSRAVYGEGMWRDEAGVGFYPGPRTHAMLSAGQWSPRTINGGEAFPLPHDAATVVPQPTSIYGATKLAQENVLAAWCASFGVPLSILRLQNVYGEGQSPYNPYTGIINIFHRLAKAGHAIPVYEDGNIIRDFIHVDDVVEVIYRILSCESAGNHKIDVGSGIPITIHEAARIIARLHGAPEPVVCGKFREGDVRAAVAHVGAMKALTGVCATVSFQEGVARVGIWLEQRGYL